MSFSGGSQGHSSWWPTLYGNAEFPAAINSDFSFTWFFRNHFTYICIHVCVKMSVNCFFFFLLGIRAKLSYFGSRLKPYVFFHWQIQQLCGWPGSSSSIKSRVGLSLLLCFANLLCQEPDFIAVSRLRFKDCWFKK